MTLDSLLSLMCSLGFLETGNQRVEVRNDEEAGMGEIWIHLRAVKMKKNNQPKEQGGHQKENQKTVHHKDFPKEGNPVDTF